MWIKPIPRGFSFTRDSARRSIFMTSAATPLGNAPPQKWMAGKNRTLMTRNGTLPAILETPKLVDHLYPSALGRRPSSAEFAIANEMIGMKESADGVEDLLWAVCMLPEFQLIR